MLEVRERKEVMKTTLKNMLIIVLLVLSGTMQAAAVEYKNNYRGVHKPDYQVQAVSTAAPTATFQSTSAYSGQLSSETQSMLNSDGSVNGDAYMGSLPGRSIRKSGTGSGTNPGTPDDEEEEEGEQQPLGDALLPMMLLLCAYAIYKVSRKQAFKTTGKSE